MFGFGVRYLHCDSPQLGYDVVDGVHFVTSALFMVKK